MCGFISVLSLCSLLCQHQTVFSIDLFLFILHHTALITAGYSKCWNRMVQVFLLCNTFLALQVPLNFSKIVESAYHLDHLFETFLLVYWRHFPLGTTLAAPYEFQSCDIFFISLKYLHVVLSSLTQCSFGSVLPIIL